MADEKDKYIFANSHSVPYISDLKMWGTTKACIFSGHSVPHNTKFKKSQGVLEEKAKTFSGLSVPYKVFDTVTV